jgi:hypothetical protein
MDIQSLSKESEGKAPIIYPIDVDVMIIVAWFVDWLHDACETSMISKDFENVFDLSKAMYIVVFGKQFPTLEMELNYLRTLIDTDQKVLSAKAFIEKAKKILYKHNIQKNQLLYYIHEGFVFPVVDFGEKDKDIQNLTNTDPNIFRSIIHAQTGIDTTDPNNLIILLVDALKMAAVIFGNILLETNKAEDKNISVAISDVSIATKFDSANSGGFPNGHINEHAKELLQKTNRRFQNPYSFDIQNNEQTVVKLELGNYDIEDDPDKTFYEDLLNKIVVFSEEGFTTDTGFDWNKFIKATDVIVGIVEVYDEETQKNILSKLSEIIASYFKYFITDEEDVNNTQYYTEDIQSRLNIFLNETQQQLLNKTQTVNKYYKNNFAAYIALMLMFNVEKKESKDGSLHGSFLDVTKDSKLVEKTQKFDFIYANTKTLFKKNISGNPVENDIIIISWLWRIWIFAQGDFALYEYNTIKKLQQIKPGLKEGLQNMLDYGKAKLSVIVDGTTKETVIKEEEKGSSIAKISKRFINKMIAPNEFTKEMDRKTGVDKKTSDLVNNSIYRYRLLDPRNPPTQGLLRELFRISCGKTFADSMQPMTAKEMTKFAQSEKTSAVGDVTTELATMDGLLAIISLMCVDQPTILENTSLGFLRHYQFSLFHGDARKRVPILFPITKTNPVDKTTPRCEWLHKSTYEYNSPGEHRVEDISRLTSDDYYREFRNQKKYVNKYVEPEQQLPSLSRVLKSMPMNLESKDLCADLESNDLCAQMISNLLITNPSSIFNGESKTELINKDKNRDKIIQQAYQVLCDKCKCIEPKYTDFEKNPLNTLNYVASSFLNNSIEKSYHQAALLEKIYYEQLDKLNQHKKQWDTVSLSKLDAYKELKDKWEKMKNFVISEKKPFLSYYKSRMEQFKLIKYERTGERKRSREEDIKPLSLSQSQTDKLIQQSKKVRRGGARKKQTIKKNHTKQTKNKNANRSKNNKTRRKRHY